MPAAELAVRLAEAYRLIGELTVQAERLSARVEQLEWQARKDSCTSSSDPPAYARNPSSARTRRRRLHGEAVQWHQPRAA